MSVLKCLIRSRDGATSIEYAIIGGLVAIAIISGVSAVGGSVGNTFNTVSDTVSAHTN